MFTHTDELILRLYTVWHGYMCCCHVVAFLFLNHAC